MKCDRGCLQAYLDDALSAGERTAVEQHLAQCADCREEMAALRQQGRAVAEQLRALDPQSGQQPDAQRALARFSARLRPARRPPARAPLARRWRWAMAAAAFLVVVAVLFSIAPVRQAAAEFLGIFRVRKFAVIPVDPGRLERLAGMEDMVEGMLGEPTLLREPGPFQAVADAAEATAVAGFPVRTPADLPGGAVQQAFAVEGGPAMRLEMNRVDLEMMLLTMGALEVDLPDVETIIVTADFGAVVGQEFQVGNDALFVIQTPSPEVTLSPDMDLTVLGEALLQFLGMPAEDARRLAREIDWTSTLVIPLPTNVAQFSEVEVDGVTGLLLDEVSSGVGGRQDGVHRLLLWQRDGIVYAVGGENVSAELLLLIADSMR